MNVPKPYLEGTDDEPLDRNYFVKIDNKKVSEILIQKYIITYKIEKLK